jgi:hypothetical protein
VAGSAVWCTLPAVTAWYGRAESQFTEELQIVVVLLESCKKNLELICLLCFS